MGLPLRILRHRATPIRLMEGEPERDWVEGEPSVDGPQPVVAETFPCALFLPLASAQDAPEQTWRPSRTVREPTLMWDPALVIGEQPASGEELSIVAAELAPWTGAVEVRWTVAADPQPFGPPGRRVVGVQATLRRVTNG